MAKSNVKIHHPDGLHWWGIEYNKPLEYENAPATEFVVAMRSLWRGESPFYRRGQWFHQYGSYGATQDDAGITQYSGYQYFEYWGNDQEYLLQVAKAVADTLGVEVEL